jgi:hypothetical protein
MVLKEAGMLRKTTFVLVVISLIAFGLVADEKKAKPKSSGSKKGGGGLSTLNTDTSKISASEGSTAQAIRGIMEPGDGGAAVIGFVNGLVTARDRVSGRTFKFSVPATSNIHIGDKVVLNSGLAQVAGVTGQFSVSGGRDCCHITAVNADHTVVVTETALGRRFLMNLDPGNGIRVGTPVAANFKTGTAWIAGNSALKGMMTNYTPPDGLHP